MSHYYVLKQDTSPPSYVFTTKGLVLLTFSVNDAEFYETVELANQVLNQAPDLAAFSAVEIEEA
jgi:hypothetical protein